MLSPQWKCVFISLKHAKSVRQTRGTRHCWGGGSSGLRDCFSWSGSSTPRRCGVHSRWCIRLDRGVLNVGFGRTRIPSHAATTWCVSSIASQPRCKHAGGGTVVTRATRWNPTNINQCSSYIRFLMYIQKMFYSSKIETLFLF